MIYDNILRVPDRKKDRSLTAGIAACVIILLLAAAAVIWVMGYHQRYVKFVAGLSESTTYAFENHCLLAEVNGQRLKVNGGNAYKIYTYISSSGSGREEKKKSPDGADILLDFGNGTRLGLWKAEKKTADGKKEKLLLSFEDAQGKLYTYSSSEMSLETLQVRYLDSLKNRREEG